MRRGPESRTDLQPPFDAAVVMPTTLRPSLLKAVRSVFAQDYSGRIQILIGIDVPEGDKAILERLDAECPERIAITTLDLGYSTAKRHGGPYDVWSGGGLRTILSYAANSTHVAYLDDDNWWAPHHLSDLLRAIEGFDCAFALRWFVDGASEEILGLDDFISVGPGKGAYTDGSFHGLVDTNCLMVNKARCHALLPYWSISLLCDRRRR